MKPFFAAIGIIVFAGILLFGAFIMMNHDRCPLTLMGDGCKTGVDPLEYALAHIGALTELTNIIAASGAIAALVAFITLIYIVSSFDFKKIISVRRKKYYFYRESEKQTIGEKLTKWMAIHEKRDCSSALAASV